MDNQVQEKKNSGKIGKRLVTGMFFIAVVPLFLSSYVGYIFSRDILIDNSLDQLELDLESRVLEVRTTLNAFRNEVLFLSNTPPIQGIIRSSSNNGIDPIDNSSYDQWITRLQTIFTEVARSDNNYLQLRYINEAGDELVRVDSDGTNTLTKRGDDLQNKFGRYYFFDTMQLDDGDVYISNLDLNREGPSSDIEIPYKPVIRFATPIFDDFSGERKGIIITNINASRFLNNLRNISDLDDIELLKSENRFFIDNNGYYFLHTDRSKEWGHPRDLDTGHNVYKDFPEDVTRGIFSGRVGSVDLPSLDISLAYAPFYIEDGAEDFWVLFETVPRSLVLNPINSLRNILFVIVVLLTIGSIIFAFVFSRSLSRKISLLTTMAQSIAKGNFSTRSDIQSDDEIGILSKAFNSMADSLLDSQEDLDRKIKDKTEDLNKGKVDLESQKRAILNVLEDVEVEKNNVVKERNKINAILSNIGDGVFAVDINRNIMVFNIQAENISGFKASEVMGKRYDSTMKFVDERDNRKNVSGFIEEVFKTGKIKEMPSNAVLVRKDGKVVPVADSAAPLTDKAGNVIGCIVVFRDVTREREIEKSKSEFVSIASHQLRTPMTGIRWVVERMSRKENLSEKGKEYLNDLATSINRLTALVDNLLDVSRIESGRIGVNPQDIDFVAFVNDYLIESKPLIKSKKLNLVFDKHPQKLNIKTDQSALRNIVQSLISNAIEYTPEGGSIEICVEEAQNQFIFRVKDSGIGIPKSAQSKIFTKFGRADNAKSFKADGTGLGLYIVKQAVELLGGQIIFTSEENKGTEFVVNLPTESKFKEGDKSL